MLREAVGAGLAGLGLVGGVAVVKHDDSGNTKVEISKGGKTSTVSLPGSPGGPTYYCPPGATAKADGIDETSGRIKLTLRGVEAQLDEIDAQYPGHTAPAAVADRYNALLERDRQLVSAFNSQVDRRNAILDAECSTEEP